jgi:hypothetical protein
MILGPAWGVGGVPLLAGGGETTGPWYLDPKGVDDAPDLPLRGLEDFGHLADRQGRSWGHWPILRNELNHVQLRVSCQIHGEGVKSDYRFFAAWRAGVFHWSGLSFNTRMM